MDNITEPFFTAEFGKEIAKSLIIAAATTAGMVGGFIAVGIVVKAVKDHQKSKHAVAK
jgi:predicted deacylase